jgi:Zn-dependent peptidase ImmA (M78 family)/DNA-binding XRE family transcriptional regulator
MPENILEKIDLRKLGERLRRARKRQGLTQAAAAKIINVARTTMTAIEKGERRIKASELLLLAETYGKTVAEFVREGPIVEPLAVQFRSTIKVTSEDMESINKGVDLLIQLCTNYYELEQLVDEPLIRNYPPIYQYRDLGLNTDQAAEGLAMTERNRLGLGNGPFPILRDILEKDVGLRIFYLPFKPSGKISEVYFFDPILGGCIGINQLHKGSKGRCRWALAHAYAHFLAHRTRVTISIRDRYERKPESERFADSFAYFLLMPTSGITQRFNAVYQAQGRVTPADLVKLARYYGVSFQAMVLRLEDMRLIPSGVWEKLKERNFSVTEAQAKLELDAIPEPTDMLPSRYVKLAIKAYHAAELSEGELADYLQEDRLKARTIASNPKWWSSTYEAIDKDVRELVKV